MNNTVAGSTSSGLEIPLLIEKEQLLFGEIADSRSGQEIYRVEVGNLSNQRKKWGYLGLWESHLNDQGINLESFHWPNVGQFEYQSGLKFIKNVSTMHKFIIILKRK